MGLTDKFLLALKAQGWQIVQVHPMVFYLSRKSETNEVCIEPRFEGFDVALYDLDQNLVIEKKITFSIDDFPAAMAMANKLIGGGIDD